VSKTIVMDGIKIVKHWDWSADFARAVREYMKPDPRPEKIRIEETARRYVAWLLEQRGETADDKVIKLNFDWPSRPGFKSQIPGHAVRADIYKQPRPFDDREFLFSIPIPHAGKYSRVTVHHEREAAP
jgi:hypothetical protein